MLWKFGIKDEGLEIKNEGLRMKECCAGLLPTGETGEGLAFLNSRLLTKHLSELPSPAP